MRGLRALAWFVGAAAACGCSLLTNFGGLAGGPASDAGGSDATTFDGAADAAPPSDGGPGSDAADAFAPPGFCATHAGHGFCVDFDDGGLPGDWTEAVSLGSVTWSTATALSPPGAMRSTVPRRQSDKENAQLRKNVSNGFRRAIVELDVYVEPPNWLTGDINAGIFDIGLYSSTVNGAVAISVGETYVTLGNPGAPMNGNPIAVGRWVHLKFDLDPAGSFDATIESAHFHQSFPALDAGAAPYTEIILGVDGYNAPAPEFVVYYDNVLIDLQ